MVRRSPDLLACARVREDLDAHLSGRLPSTRDAAVEAHLERCPACRDELALAAVVRRELSALPRFDVPPRVIEAARRQVHAPSAPQPELIGRRANLRLPIRAVLAAAAVAAVAAAVVLLRPDQPGHSPQAPAAEVALATVEARLAFALVADATNTARRELRDGVLRDRVIATAARGVSRSLRLDSRSGDIEGRQPKPTSISGGSS